MHLSASHLGFLFEESHRQFSNTLLAKGDPKFGHGEAAYQTVARTMGQLGLYQTLLPASGKVDVRQLCLVREWLGQLSPLADAIFAVQGLGTYPIYLAGSEAQKKLLQEFSAGDRIAGFALTEPSAGSDVAAMETVAVQKPGGYELSGCKTLISNVGIASHYAVFAKTDPAAGSRGITAFWLPSDAQGLVSKSIVASVDHPLGELTLKQVFLPDSAVIGTVGKGFGLAMQTLDTFRVSVGAAACGMATAALSAATEHAAQRNQFGEPLLQKPVIQSLLAEAATSLDAMRLMVYRAAWEKDHQLASAAISVAMAKLFSTENAQKIIDTAVQLFGGQGVCLGNPAEMFYRAIRPLRIYEGTSEIQRLIIGRSIAKNVGS